MYTHLPQVLTILPIRVYNPEVILNVVVLDCLLLLFVMVVEIAFEVDVYFGALKRFIIIPDMWKGSIVFLVVTSVDFYCAFSRCHVAYAFSSCTSSISVGALTIIAIVSAMV